MDIEEIVRYIAAYNPEAAASVSDAIFDSIDVIEEDPERSPRFSPHSFANEFLRRKVVFPFRNYLIFYELTDAKIRVLYVHHGNRDFEGRYLKERRK